MAYDHKKSLRTLTDEQFSDGTTIDGSRIDDALQESVEHFNSVPHGDVSTRFTKTQYIFGYQPAGYTGTPDSTGTGGASQPDFLAVGGSCEGPTWPWNFIRNNEFTSAEVDPSTPTFGIPSTPTAGFQNRWRVKGTEYHQTIAPGVQRLENEGSWADPTWESSWATGGAAIGAIPRRDVGHNYQLAWSHSWVFEVPVIIDALSLMMRTDMPDPATADTGYYSAPFEFTDGLGITRQTQSLNINISVDNEFAKEDRSLNDIEFAFGNRRLDGYTVTSVQMAGTGYRDMVPNSPEYDSAASTGNGLSGRLIRHRDLNIPIRQGARVRLSVTIPWFKETLVGKNALDQQGLSSVAPARSVINKYFNWANPPSGAEPMFNWAIDGCMTVLEQVTS